MSGSRPGLYRSNTDVDETSRPLSALFRDFHHSKRASLSSMRQGVSDVPIDGSRTLSTGGKARFSGFYDDFTTVDWVRDGILDSERRTELRRIPGLRGKMIRVLDGGEGWLLITIVAVVFALLVYIIDISEEFLTHLRTGYCTSYWLFGPSSCQDGDWLHWDQGNAFLIYLVLSVIFAGTASLLTLRTKTDNPLLERERYDPESEAGDDSSLSDIEISIDTKPTPNRVITYTAYGSGVPEVKTILSGFIIRKFLGLRTLIYKSLGLVFSISSGLAVGQEGPCVHLAVCVGNIACRLFPKFSQNEIKRRQVLSAAASAGVALAFGSPLGGVLFSLEEVSYYFLPHQLFRIFFCAMMSALGLKFLDPYGTGKIVLFEVKYSEVISAWEIKEILHFVLLGVVGGLYGAYFAKFALFWGGVRSKKYISHFTEVIGLAIITCVLSYSNKYASSTTADLLLRLASQCTEDSEDELCAISKNGQSDLWSAVPELTSALFIKAFLTAITFGAKVPSGIYAPSMIVGALFGRIYGIVAAQATNVSGVYAMAGAGAFLAGVTRMNVTLAVILFELTGSMAHVLPFSIAILVANWIGNAIEHSSLYELLIHANRLPFLDNRTTPFSDEAKLEELATLIDIKSDAISLENNSENNLVSTERLRIIASRHMFDACVPIIRNDVCIGTIPVPELEYALDQSPSPESWCRVWKPNFFDNTEAVDLTPLVDTDPITLDLQSSLALVQMVFSKMGARQICVSRNGHFVGLLHRKKFIDFVSTC